MLENAEHDDNVCLPGCCLKHAFCTVKLSVPNLKTRSQNIVEVCVDLPTRLQLGSFTAFAQSDKVEDAWVLLSAGQSPELATLSQMFGKTKDTSGQPAGIAMKAPSNTLPKIPARKRASSGTLSCHLQHAWIPLLSLHHHHRQVCFGYRYGRV